MYGSSRENLDKNYILSRLTEEQIFEYYLGVPVQFRRKIKSPLRKDETPTCGFAVDNRGVLKFRDFSGHFHGDCFNVVQFIYSVGFAECLLIICRDFNLSQVSVFTPEQVQLHQQEREKIPAEIRIKRQPWTETDKTYWKSFGIRSATLKHYEVSSISHAWVNGSCIYTYKESDPGYAYTFRDEETGEVIGYKLYFPLREDRRFLTNLPYVLQGYRQLPPGGECLVVTKSLKDVMLLQQYGIPAVAPPGESSILSQGEYEELTERFTTLVSLYDFDLAGVRGAQRMKRLYNIPAVFLTNGRFNSENYGAKDPSDYRRKYGEEQFLTLLRISTHGKYPQHPHPTG